MNSKIIIGIVIAFVVFGGVLFFTAQTMTPQEATVLQQVRDAHATQEDTQAVPTEALPVEDPAVAQGGPSLSGDAQGGVAQLEEGGGIAFEGKLPENTERQLPAICGDYDPVVESVAAPNFTLDQLGGGSVTLSSYKDQKPVVLDFWNTWCHNCQRDMPQLNSLYQKYENQFEVIGVNLLPNNDKESRVERFVQTNGITFPIVYDREGFAAAQYGIRLTNTHVMINKDGTVFDAFPADIHEDQLQCFLAYNETL